MSLVTAVEHTGNAKPIKQRMRKIPASFVDDEEAHLKKMLDAGVMQENDPPLPWVISLLRGMTRIIILRREMTTDRRYRTPPSSSRMTPS